MAVSKSSPPEVYNHFVESLALSFVDGYGPSQTNGKLAEGPGYQSIHLVFLRVIFKFEHFPSKRSDGFFSPVLKANNNRSPFVINFHDFPQVAVNPPSPRVVIEHHDLRAFLED